MAAGVEQSSPAQRVGLPAASTGNDLAVTAGFHSAPPGCNGLWTNIKSGPTTGGRSVQCYPLYSPSGMSNKTWPPEFSLDQEKILGLLTGDRFYSNPSAALREVLLNAIDAVHRHRQVASDVVPAIQVIFSRDDLTLTVTDNGIGMSQTDVSALFAKVGASAATNEAKKDSVGEFGIGVISYFMAGDVFTLQTYDGTTAPIGLSFDRHMLSGRAATEVPPTQHSQGTAITIHLRNTGTFDLLLDSFPHWCRDVADLSGLLLPDRRPLMQKGDLPDFLVQEQ